jgi:hypothetical protein
MVNKQIKHIYILSGSNQPKSLAGIFSIFIEKIRFFLPVMSMVLFLHSLNFAAHKPEKL